MVKFKHGFPVSSAVMVGFLSLHNKANREELIRLATAMVLSEELNHDIKRMAEWFNADLELAYSFQLPESLDAHTVWSWRFEGMQIIKEAANSVFEEVASQAQRTLSESPPTHMSMRHWGKNWATSRAEDCIKKGGPPLLLKLPWW